MSEQDRNKWDAKYAGDKEPPAVPSLLLTELDDLLPRKGRALDIAGGAGRHAIWLALRGMTVTLADISSQGIAIALQRASDVKVAIDGVETDLEVEPLPAGPWDLITSFFYLHRPLFDQIPAALAPGGLLVFAQPTLSNLQRNNKPPERFLLKDGEAPSLAKDLEIIHYQEGWSAEGRHEAQLVARRPA